MKPADETGKGRRRQSWKDLGMLKSLVFITRTMGGNLIVVGQIRNTIMLILERSFWLLCGELLKVEQTQWNNTSKGQ